MLISRTYWLHWRSVSQWARDHPASDDSLPISIYGDEARFSQTHSDKFVALCLQSPLLHKRRGDASAQFRL